jgi:hypothetical protein
MLVAVLFYQLVAVSISLSMGCQRLDNGSVQFEMAVSLRATADILEAIGHYWSVDV